MNIIVDANIVFSGILNTNGKIANLLINSQDLFTFIAPDFLRVEIRKHHPKLIKISGLTKAQIEDAEFRVCRQINFISEEQIKPANWLAAENLVIDVDPKDVQYVAYSKQFRCKIWSGDKAFMIGLAKKNFHSFISTTELYELFEKSGA